MNIYIYYFLNLYIKICVCVRVYINTHKVYLGRDIFIHYGSASARLFHGVTDGQHPTVYGKIYTRDIMSGVCAVGQFEYTVLEGRNILKLSFFICDAIATASHM